MSRISKYLTKTLGILFLALVALPILGGATVSAVSQTFGTTINVIVNGDGVNLSLNGVNGEKNDDDSYTTTQNTATVVFEASGVGDIEITDSDGNVVFSTTKTTPESEEITAVFPIGDEPGTYDYTITMESGSGFSKTISFQLILEAVNLPEIPILPNLPGLPNTGYVKVFGYLVTSKGITSLVFLIIVFLVAVACLVFALAKNKQPKKQPVNHHVTKRKTSRAHRSKK